MSLSMKPFAKLFLCLLPFSSTVWGEEVGEWWGTAERERAYYRITEIPIPKGLVIEAGAFVTLPDGRIAIGTRRGDVFLSSGIDRRKPSPTFELFASGLDEIFGLAYKDDAFYVTQSCELTRVTDRNGDGRADKFETISDGWGYGNYHEYAFGTKFDPEGNLSSLSGFPIPIIPGLCSAGGP